MADLKPFVATVRKVYETSFVVWAEDERDAGKRLKEADDEGEVGFSCNDLRDTEIFSQPIENSSSPSLEILNPEDIPGLYSKESKE